LEVKDEAPKEEKNLKQKQLKKKYGNGN